MITATTGTRVPWPYLLLFIAVYAIQGVVFAYFINFNPTYMRAGGVPEATVGTVQTIALLPFILKFLAGPLSDRFSLFGLGHRKPYILLGLLLQILGLLGLAAFRGDLNATVGLFTAVAVLTVTGLALYDTCTDGLIVDITPAEDRARVQGLLMFSRFLTATVFSLFFGLWLDQTGTGPGQGHRVLWVCAALSLLPLILTMVLPEPRRLASGEEFAWEALRVLIRPRSIALLAFGTFYAIVAYGVEINLPLFYDRLDYGAGAVGSFGAARNLGRAAGALMLPFGMRLLGRKWVLGIAVLALAGSEAAQALGMADAGPFVGALGFAFGAANGWTEALFYVMAMEASDPRLAASTYALFMAVTNLSVTGGAFFGQTVRAFDGAYRPAFVTAALTTLLALGLVRPLARPPREKEISEGNDVLGL